MGNNEWLTTDLGEISKTFCRYVKLNQELGSLLTMKDFLGEGEVVFGQGEGEEILLSWSRHTLGRLALWSARLDCRPARGLYMLQPAVFCLAVPTAPGSSRQCRHGSQHPDNGLLAYLHASGSASAVWGNVNSVFVENLKAAKTRMVIGNVKQWKQSREFCVVHTF